MKKILIMFAIALAYTIVFNGCSKDNNSIEPQNQVVGKWKATSHKETLNGSPIVGNDIDIAAVDMVIEFNSNLSYTATAKGENALKVELGTYAINGSTINMNPTGERDYSLTFTITDGILHVYSQNTEYNGTYIRETILVRIS